MHQSPTTTNLTTLILEIKRTVLTLIHSIYDKKNPKQCLQRTIFLTIRTTIGNNFQYIYIYIYMPYFVNFKSYKFCSKKKYKFYKDISFGDE